VYRLIEQLRCGLRAKDVIIEQLEEEKKELAHETAHRYENHIKELTEKLKTFEMDTETLAQVLNAILKIDEIVSLIYLPLLELDGYF
jgi:hypothetical protein